MTRDKHQSESTAHAKADDADTSIAAGQGSEPGTGRFDVVESGPTAGDSVTHDFAKTEDAPTTVVQVDCYGENASGSEPIGLVAVVTAHAPSVMKNDHAGHSAAGRGRCHIGTHLAPGRGNEDVGYAGTSCLAAALPLIF